LAITLRSPDGAFATGYPVLLAQFYFPPPTPLAIGRFPELHVDRMAVIAYDGLGGAPLAGGVTLLFGTPAGASGFVFRVQGLAVSPLAANGFFAVSDAHQVVVL
jgi:hypothetical protein